MKWLRELWRGGKSLPVLKAPVPEPPQLSPAGPVAIISDVHGNLQALQVVRADIEKMGVRERVCLGDIVGYGGNPVECLELIRASGFRCIQGNHDSYAGENCTLPERSADFQAARKWMREAMGEERCRWLAELPLTLDTDDYEAVHASLHHPAEWPYVLMQGGAALHFRHQEKPVCFVGHTHQPKMWVEDKERSVEGAGVEALREGCKMMVDVGSVGQPRDEDSRACYVIHRRDKRDVWWRRLPYDIEGAQRAIMAAGLPGSYAGRLARGK